jgi:hypothetical protein
MHFAPGSIPIWSGKRADPALGACPRIGNLLRLLFSNRLLATEVDWAANDPGEKGRMFDQRRLKDGFYT